MTRVFCDLCGKEVKVRRLEICDLTYDICDECNDLIQSFFRKPRMARKAIDDYFLNRRHICEKNFLKTVLDEKND